MAQYWTRKGDQEDLDDKTAKPFAEFVGHGNVFFPDPNTTKQKTATPFSEMMESDNIVPDSDNGKGK